ncbi:MAG: hypothetical protein J1E96_05660 [Ruminococcus sp.]|nr:hypothetical protein [Ruminococcus sp.]
MNTFRNFHPLTLALYFLSVIGISIFTFNPLYLSVGFFGSVLFLITLAGLRTTLKQLRLYIIIFIIVTATNPIFSHNGATVLFFINDNRITLEALVYGAVLGLMIVEVLVWFKCFNLVFDSERLLYLFGKAFPKLALVVSIALGFVPQFIRTFKSINSAQKSMNTKQGRVRRYLASFSAVITRSMESAIVTSDSMKSRGYGLRGRTHFSRFRFTSYDAVYLFLFLLMFVCTLPALLFGHAKVQFYPYISFANPTVSLLSFAVLAMIPSFFEVKEGLKWKYSISKI